MLNTSIRRQLAQWRKTRTVEIPGHWEGDYYIFDESVQFTPANPLIMRREIVDNQEHLSFHRGGT